MFVPIYGTRKLTVLPGSQHEFSSSISSRPFDSVDTTSWEVSSIEPSGAEIKCVLIDPENPSIRWFFKNNTEDEQMRYGEDFAEVISSHLAPLLGVSSAQVLFATRKGIDGVISKNVAPIGLELVHGATWLPAHGVPDFQSGDKYRRGHSLVNIHNALTGIAAPPDSVYPEELTAFDAFAGMCIFDALISNQDRHEDNWAVLNPMIRREGLVARLSPIYDNGSSLGFNVSESKMSDMLTDAVNPRIEQFSARAKANRLERLQPGNRRLKLIEAAVVALEMCSEAGKQHWKGRISSLDLKQAREITHEIAQMSDVRRKFVNELITVNIERIQNACLGTT